jgi:membrane carboxypeptidase/penicillin-binding protein
VPILNIIRQRRQRRTQVRSSTQQRTQRAVFGFGFTLSAALVVTVLLAALAYAGLTRSLPPVEELSILLNPIDGQLLQPTRLVDRTGQHLLAVLAPGDTPRVYVLYDQLPQSLINATIAGSQPDFWSSPGYVIAGWQEPGTHPTLAQRLVSDLLLGDQPASVLRGIHERMLAGQITAAYGRQKVLEWVVNSTDYGHYAYGVEAAAQVYLGKSITQINLGEAALLAAIGQAPAVNPIDAPRAVEQNRLQVVRAMLNQGMISPDEAAQAVRNPPAYPAPSTTGIGMRGSPQVVGEGEIAPALVNLALSELDAQFGPGRVERGGLTITTSLDYDLQLQAVCVARNQLNRLAGSAAEISAADGTPCAGASRLSALQPGERLPGASTSILMLDPQTGQILVAVGDIQGGLQNDSLAYHPAGTSITPFIYLTGFSRGLNPASLGWDIPVNAPAPGQVYHGPVRLRTALANDYLPPAISLLGQMGQDSVQSIAAPFGLYFPSGLHLLQDEFNISPLSLAEAYGIFANGGTLAGQTIGNTSLHSTAVLKVSAVDHSVWVDWTTARTRLLLSQQLAYLMNQVLSDETARWPTLGHPNPLEIGRPAGAKLAHALDLSAAWTVGYTPQRVTVVWLGTGASEPAAGVSKGAVPVPSHFAADLWHAIMQVALRDLPTVSWDMPPGIVNVRVCDPSGLLPTSTCPNVVDEIFLDGRQPVQVDTLFQVFQVNAESGLLATVFTPPELVENRTYMIVPPEARLWAACACPVPSSCTCSANTGGTGPGGTGTPAPQVQAGKAAGIPLPPTAYDTVQKQPVLPYLHITSPGMFAEGRGVLEIRGSAAGSDFYSYRLEFGQGLYPRLWQQIGADSRVPVTEGLLGSWDTTGLNGLFALRLMVVRSDQRVDQAVVQVTLDNTAPQVAISYPQSGQTISAAQEPQVALQAQASDPFLENVAFYVDDVLVGRSSLEPFGVVWAAKTGEHVLKVVATDQAGNTAEVRINFTVGK